MIKNVERKNILLTFDYELFFKRSGSFERCIKQPVNQLIELFKKNSVNATFFIDVLYYIRMMDYVETREMAKELKKQLQQLVKLGNRIELHLHPHWLDAEWHDGNWHFPHYNRYRLQSLKEEEILKLFQLGCQTLEDIAREVDPEYKVVAFRAGGWCIQPFTILRSAFSACHIKIDSSVASNIKGTSEAHYFDFSNVPAVANYRFSDDPTVADESGEFVEMPISTYRRHTLDKFRRKAFNLVERKHMTPFGDGEGIPLSRSFRDKFLPTMEMISLERMFPRELVQVIEKYNGEAINIISHPKGLSPMSLRCLSELAQRHYRFLTLKQYYEEHVMFQKE